jgi:hypothetical protein
MLTTMVQNYDRDIICQNCLNMIGRVRAGGPFGGSFGYSPAEQDVLTQGIGKDTCLMNLQCNKCGCVTQIVT